MLLTAQDTNSHSGIHKGGRPLPCCCVGSYWPATRNRLGIRYALLSRHQGHYLVCMHIIYGLSSFGHRWIIDSGSIQFRQKITQLWTCT